MRKFLLCSFLILICTTGISAADISVDTAYYPGDNLLISLTGEEIPNDNTLAPVEDYTDTRTWTEKIQQYILAIYGYLTGFPSAFISETIATIFILLGAGACTLLLTRWKLPEDPNSRPRILLNTIREHPGATHLSVTSKIRKSVQNGKTRYYLACTPDDEMKGFLRKLTTQENPQKILEAIISNPGISQKELHETTGIPKTTLQWHLSQLAKYEAIQSTRERNTVHYSVISDLVLLYHHILEETVQNKKSDETKEPDNNKES